MQVVELIEFRSFKEKVKITKKYDRIAKMSIVDNRYVYIELKEDVR